MRADSIHRRGTRSHMPTRTPSRTRAAVARTLPELEAALAGRPDVALVPTMGALHDGHRALLRAARATGARSRHVAVREPGAVRAGRGLRPLPRDEGADVAIAGEEGADVVFAPASRRCTPRASRRPSTPARSRSSSRAVRGPGTSRRRDGGHAPVRPRSPAARVLRREGLPAARDRARRRARPRARRRGRRHPDGAGRGRPRAVVAQPLLSPAERAQRSVAATPASRPPARPTPAASATPAAHARRRARSSPSSPTTSSCAAAPTSAPTTLTDPAILLVAATWARRD